MKYKLLSIGFFIIFIFTLQSSAQVFDMFVAKEGPGAYRSLSSAISRVTDNNAKRTVIFIKNGEYKEKVTIPSSKINVSIIGESVEGVVINWNDYNGDGTSSTSSSATFWADCANLYVENITIKNSAGAVGQAVAIRTTGDKQIFKNCRFTGFQDTYYAHSKRQYNVNCYVEGATDFIFGDATAVFDNCIIQCLNGGHYMTAPADSKLTSKAPWGNFIHGFMFKNSTITAEEGVADDSYYLARPWQPYASCVYINCKMGSHIRKLGWSVWSPSENHLTAFFAENNSKTLEGESVDISGRATWSKQLADTIVRDYYNLDSFYFKSTDPWNPFPIEEEPFNPQNLTVSNSSLTWKLNDSCKGFVVFRNDSLIGFTDGKSFNDTTASKAIDNNYYVKAVSIRYGNMSEPSNEVLVKGLVNRVQNIIDDYSVSFVNKHITATSISNIQVYSISGVLIKVINNTTEMRIDDLSSGIYIVKSSNSKGKVVFLKIIR